MNKRLEYGKLNDLMKSYKSKEETEIKGVFNYQLKSIYAPVLDRKFIDNFEPELTCISIQGNKTFEINEDKLIKDVIERVKELKEYHLESPHGQKENIGEYSLFSEISLDDYDLSEYSFGINSKGKYYLIVWYTPNYNESSNHRHVYWYGKKHNGEWY